MQKDFGFNSIAYFHHPTYFAKLMEEITLDKDLGKSNSKQYAGFWIRFAAIFIDAILVSILNAFISILLGKPAFSPEPDSEQSLISTLTGWLYFAILESSARQATLGKMAVGIRVVNKEGEGISFAQATGRYFSKILSTLILLIGFIMAAFDERKQALHDRIASTFVVRD